MFYLSELSLYFARPHLLSQLHFSFVLKSSQCNEWMDWIISSNTFLVACGILLGLLLSLCLYGIKQVEQKIKGHKAKVRALAMEKLTLVNRLDNLEREHVKNTKIIKYGRLTDCEIKKSNQK